MASRRVKKKKAPELPELLEARDYVGATTLLDFQRALFLDTKHASGWRPRDNAAGFDWIDGRTTQLTPDERADDEQRCLWLAYAAYHARDFKKALDTYTMMAERGSQDPMLPLYQACCHLAMGEPAEAERHAERAPACALRSRLLFQSAHRQADEDKLMAHHQTLEDTTYDQLTLASVHFLRSHYQEATDVYKKVLLENREFLALNVSIALCYYKLDYFDVSLEILSSYLHAYPDSATALNIRACNQYRLYDGKAAEAELAPITKEAPSIDKIDNELVRHNLVIFQDGERALQVLPALVGKVPEARLNLVIYHMKRGDAQEAYELMKDVEPLAPSEYILKAITNLVLGQQLDSREHLKVAQQYFQLLGASASECDTIPGRQCMASCFFILRQFDDVLIYLSSIEAYFPNDPAFQYNYAIARAAAGKYAEAEAAMQNMATGPDGDELSRDPTFRMWLARCCVMCDKAQQAWEIYLKIEGTQDSFAMLQLLANDCYRAGAFLVAAKAFEALERLDPSPEYWEGKRGACVGVFQQIVAGKQRKEVLREVLGLLKSTRNPQVEYLTRVMKKWGRDKNVNL